MSKKQCELSPMIGDEPSKLYLGLSEKLNKIRPLVNYMYACYLQPGVAADMDKAGYIRNSQGEHNAVDVYNYFKGSSFVETFSEHNDIIAKKEGTMNNFDEFVDFPTFEEAHQKAEEINKKYKGKVAYVSQSNDIDGKGVFNVFIDEKDANTQIKTAEMEENIKLWESLKEAFEPYGINLEEASKMYPFQLNPLRAKELIRNLRNLQINHNLLNESNIKTLLALNWNNPLVQQAIKRGWGTIDEITDKVYKALQDPTTVTQGNMDFINNMIDSCQEFSKADLNKIEDRINRESTDFEDKSDEYSILKTIEDLHEKFKINIKEIVAKEKDIDKLSKVAARAALVLQRQINALNTRKGSLKTSKRLELMKQKIMDDLEKNHSYSGLIQFLGEATKYISIIEKEIAGMDPNLTGLEKAKEIANVKEDIDKFYNSYYPIVNILSNIKKIQIDEFLRPQDLKNLETLAKDIKKKLESFNSLRKDFEDQGIDYILREILPGLDPLTYTSLKKIGLEDTYAVERLFTASRSANPVLNSAGTLLARAQKARDKKLEKFSKINQRAFHKLHKAGFSEGFMYDSDGRIVSPYDWNKYFQSYYKYYYALKEQGIRGAALKELMQNWEEANTYEVEVDKVNHRMERLPLLSNYSNDKFQALYNSWHPAQQEYYNTMLDLKAQLDTLLPESAQRLYNPPQVRIKGGLNVLEAYSRGQISFKKAISLMTDKINFIKKREDEDRFAASTIQVLGSDVSKTRSDYADNPLRSIPVYFVNPIEDKSDLSRNFSSTLQAYASMAYNYEAMSNIENLLILVKDYIQDSKITESDNKVKKAEVIVNNAVGKTIEVFAPQHKKGENNISAIVEGILSMYLYNDAMKNSKTTKWIIALIKFGNWKNLTLNVLGAKANAMIGEWRMLVDALGGEFYNLKDYMWAHAKLFETSVLGAPGKIIDLINNEIQSKEVLLARRFDPLDENYSEFSHKEYHTNAFMSVMKTIDSSLLYHIGEYIIHYINMFSMMHREKIVLDGKVTNLYEAFETTDSIDGVKELKIKDGARQLNGDLIDEEFLDGFQNRLRYVNENAHGAMNSDRYGWIHSKLAGKVVMNYRQWMVESYSRELRGEHYDDTTAKMSLTLFLDKNYVLRDDKKISLRNALERVYDDPNDKSNFHLAVPKDITTLSGKPVTEEYLETLYENAMISAGKRMGSTARVYELIKSKKALKLIKAIGKDTKTIEEQALLRWTDLTMEERADVNRFLGKIVSLVGLSVLDLILGEYKDVEDKDRNYFYLQFLYLVKRINMDAWAYTVPGFFNSFSLIINAPIPAVNTINQIIYPATHFISDIGKTIERGPHAGENKWWRNFKKYAVPFYNQLDMLINLAEDDRLFKMYND